MPYNLDNLPADWKKSDYACVVCKNHLWYIDIDKGVYLWCGSENCSCVSTNQKVFGKNEKEAFEFFKYRLNK